MDQDWDGDGDVVGDVAMLRLLWHHWHFQSLGGRHKASTHIQNRLSVGLSFSFLALHSFRPTSSSSSEVVALYRNIYTEIYLSISLPSLAVAVLVAVVSFC